MGSQIHLQNVSLTAKNKVLFENFSFDFCKGKDVCLIGEEGVGKTSLLRAILGEVPIEGEILKEASCRGVLRIHLKGDESIADYLHYESLDERTQKQIRQFLKLKSLLYPINKLTEKYQLKVLLLEQILKYPKFFFVDDILFSFSMQEKRDFISLLYEFDITLFYVTSNLEDALLFPYLLVMGRHGILMEGSTISVLKEEKILKRLGFSLPFMVDLSLQLQSYDLLQQIYLDRKELSEKLWKSD